MHPGEVPGTEHTDYLIAAGKQSRTGVWGGWSAAKTTENNGGSLELRYPERVIETAFMSFIAMTRGDSQKEML